jgi:hypothetical protein
MNRETKLDIHIIFVLIIVTGETVTCGVTALFHCKNLLQVDIVARGRGKSCWPRYLL